MHYNTYCQAFFHFFCPLPSNVPAVWKSLARQSENGNGSFPSAAGPRNDPGKPQPELPTGPVRPAGQKVSTGLMRNASYVICFLQLFSIVYKMLSSLFFKFYDSCLLPPALYDQPPEHKTTYKPYTFSYACGQRTYNP
jgi:hypothetical protein